MNFRFQPKVHGLGLALLAGLFGLPSAQAELAASANYVLQRGSLTLGISDAATPLGSANYRLVAGNLGDISAPSVASANYVQHPGYLVPLDSVYSRPNLVSVAVQGGRVWLEWTAIPNAVSYRVESASGTNPYVQVQSVSGVARWDAAVPVATSRFYRIRAIQQ